MSMDRGDNELIKWYVENCRQLYAEDDVSGSQLDPKMVIQARRTELEFFRRMRVYEKVPRWKAQRLNKKIIQTRWIDVNKGDDQNPDYRSRLVAKEFRDSCAKGLETFAATPPAEMLKVLISRCTTASRGGERGLRNKCIMTNDVKRAYFYADVRSDIFVEIPPEDKIEQDVNEDNVAMFKLSLYCTREPTSALQHKARNVVEILGFSVSMINPCIFKQKLMGIECMVHGDDFISIGNKESLEWFKKALEREFEIKTTVIGWHEKAEKEMRVLNQIIRITNEGVEYEADQRHAELVVKQLDLESSNSVVTPVDEDIESR